MSNPVEGPGGMSKMRVLVTGANGLVGSRLCALLQARGHEVSGAGRGPCRIPGWERYLRCELSSASEVEKAFSAARPELVIHTASMTEVDACEQHRDAAYAANVTAAAQVASACAKAGAHLVHVSTDYVFDGARGDYAEEDRPNPRGVYAVTKWLGEEAVRVLAPSWAIARTAVVYDWPPAGRPNFGAWLVDALGRGERVRLFADQFVSPTLASDLAAMLAELGERRLPGIWHTAGAEVVNRVAFAEALCARFGFDPSLIVPSRLNEAKLASPRPAKSGLSVKKAQAQLCAAPEGLEASLKRFHSAWAQANPHRGTP